MNIRDRIEKLEEVGSKQSVWLFQWLDETAEQAVDRWKAQHPGESLEGRAVHILTWERSQ